jgi:hypothetical protein
MVVLSFSPFPTRRTLVPYPTGLLDDAMCHDIAFGGCIHRFYQARDTLPVPLFGWQESNLLPPAKLAHIQCATSGLIPRMGLEPMISTVKLWHPGR